MIDMVVRHPPMPMASDLLMPFLPEEEPLLDKALTLADQLKQERGIYCSPSFLLDVWMRKCKHDILTKKEGAENE